MRNGNKGALNIQLTSTIHSLYICVCVGSPYVYIIPYLKLYLHVGKFKGSSDFR